MEKHAKGPGWGPERVCCRAVAWQLQHCFAAHEMQPPVNICKKANARALLPYAHAATLSINKGASKTCSDGVLGAQAKDSSRFVSLPTKPQTGH